jgi:pimeloyl-ACP methyl ester carboxylesterase
VTKIVDHYDGIIRGLDSPPIIVGHSLGGTIVQLLLARGLPAAGVGVAPGTVRGVPDLPHFPGAPGWEEVADYFGVRIADGAVKVAPSEGVVQSPQPVDVRRQRTGR